MTYPHEPGSKRRHTLGSDTSAEAARANATRAPTQRVRVLEAITTLGTATPEQVEAYLARKGTPIMLMSCRPRCSELARLGLICDSTLRGMGAGGCAAIAWRATTPLERAAFEAEQAAERTAA